MTGIFLVFIFSDQKKCHSPQKEQVAGKTRSF